jgi:hypothetical protein
MPKAALVLALLVAAGHASGCSCVKRTGSQTYAEATLLLRGKVVATSLVSNPGVGDHLGKQVVRASVQPIEVFKGTAPASVEVIGGTLYQQPVCTRPLVAGVEYVFALDPNMVADSCNSWAADDPAIEEPLRTFRRLRNQGK